MADFDYDVSDHCNVDPIFGDLATFDALVAAAHRRGIRVIVDFVPNRTSDRHPWFQTARLAREPTPRLVRLARPGPHPDAVGPDAERRFPSTGRHALAAARG